MTNPKATQIVKIIASAEPDFEQVSGELNDVSSFVEQNSDEQSLNELAAETLAFLKAENQQRAQAIEAMSANEQNHKFELLTNVGLIVAVTVLLRTHIKVQKNAKGQWTFLLEHKPAQNKLLSSIVDKLNGWIDGGGE